MGCLLGRRAAAELGRCLTPALIRATRILSDGIGAGDDLSVRGSGVSGGMSAPSAAAAEDCRAKASHFRPFVASWNHRDIERIHRDAQDEQVYPEHPCEFPFVLCG